jgi:hypothetical protein
VEIPFIQYVLPHGRRKEIAVDRPEEVAAPALVLIEKGYRFECEMLTDMETVSLTVVGPDDDGDIAIELSRNGPEIIGAVDRLVTKAVAFDTTP